MCGWQKPEFSPNFADNVITWGDRSKATVQRKAIWTIVYIAVQSEIFHPKYKEVFENLHNTVRQRGWGFSQALDYQFGNEKSIEWVGD